MMKDSFFRHQEEATLKSLELENKRLKSETLKFKEDARKNKAILDFHHQLEKDFFSADSLEELVIKLINRLQLRQDIDFVSLALNREYLKVMLDYPDDEQFLSGIITSTRLGYLTIIEEKELANHFGSSPRAIFEKTPLGSSCLFFPDHDDEVRSHSTVPLFIRGKLIGCLNIGSTRSRHYYTTETGPDLLDRLSAKLAIAIDSILSHKKLAHQKEFLDQDINRAAILQKSLLPATLAQSEAIRFWSLFKPCRRLGGDFYDLVPLSGERVALVIADVSGHGISAALIAAMLKVSFQPEHMEKMGPAEIVSDINQKFCKILKRGDYITLCYGILDPVRRTMGVVRAGHPYPLIYRTESGDFSEIKSDGPPLGVDKKALYKNTETPLKSEDIIFFYTDGLTDAIFNKDRSREFRDIILDLGKETQAMELPKKIILEFESLLEAKRLGDDTTLLIVYLK